MTELTALTPLETMAPVQIGSVVLTEPAPEPVAAIQPYPGRGQAASDALHRLTGLEFPAPGQMAKAGDLRVLWAGRETAFLVGALPELDAVRADAAVTDLSDAWAVLRLSGAETDAVLARLSPLDLRPKAFPAGATARTELAHMTALLVRLPSAVEIWVMRSMAGSAAKKLAQAMAAVAAREALRGP